MAFIQPFTFQHCTAFRERKQIADKTNEIVNKINEFDNKINEIEDKIKDEWELCPLNTILYTGKSVKEDLKIEYSLHFTYRIPQIDNFLDEWLVGTIYLKKDDFINPISKISIIPSEPFLYAGDYSTFIIPITNVTLSNIQHGINGNTVRISVHAKSIYPSDSSIDDSVNNYDVTFQTEDKTISASNNFINIYRRVSNAD